MDSICVVVYEVADSGGMNPGSLRQAVNLLVLPTRQRIHAPDEIFSFRKHTLPLLSDSGFRSDPISGAETTVAVNPNATAAETPSVSAQTGLR